MGRVNGLSSPALPVEFVALDGGGRAVLGLTDLVASITRASDGYGWDWLAGAFQATPSHPTQGLVEVDPTYLPGLYHVEGGWTPPGDNTYTFAVTQTTTPHTVANAPELWTAYLGPLVGHATIGRSLVDSLVGVVDSLRGSLYPAFGVRQFRTYAVKGMWTGDATETGTGRGAWRITQRAELLPRPGVEFKDKHVLEEGGLREVGEATLSEISLTYTQDDLGYSATDPDTGSAFFFLLVDALGQGIQNRLYIPGEHPESHRGDKKDAAGWTLKVRRVDLAPNVVAIGGQP